MDSFTYFFKDLINSKQGQNFEMHCSMPYSDLPIKTY